MQPAHTQPAPILPTDAVIPPPTAEVAVVAAPLPNDLRPLQWGPIWAGLLTALGIFFLLSLGAIAIGVQAAPGTTQQDLGSLAVVVTSAIALVAFFIGGFISSWSAGLGDPGRSMLNGFLVWTLWLGTVVLLAALGLGPIVGAMGDLFGKVTVAGLDVDPTQLVDTLKSSSWQTLLALGLTAAASTLGGAVGAREELRGRWRGIR